MPVGVSSLGLGRTIVSGSGAVTATGATPNIGLPANAALYSAIPACEAVDILLVVTANTGTSSSVNPQTVELQTSPDGGTSWVTFWRSANITTSTTVIRTSMRTNGIGANEAAATTVGINTTTGAITQNCCITKDQRVLWTQSTSVGNVPSLTFSLFYVAQQAGTRASY